jgi:ariadne-1
MDWNKEKLIEKYMDNADAILVAAGISSEAPKSPDPSRQASARRTTRSATASGAAGSTSSHKSPKPPAVAEPFVCPICFDDSATETLALACGHAFCTGCWAAYVHSKVRGEGEHSIRCMAEGCSLVAPDVFVKRVLSDDSATFDRFRELLVRHFVACKKELKFCPYPSCTYTVACPAAASKSSLATIVPTVTCGGSSAHRFCFGCDVEGDHRPCICAVARMWLKKCADDSETANWIKSNTKECSKCQSTIEKNGGCK